MICPHGHDEGMVERLATPEEVDAGAELGIAFDPCPKCVNDEAIRVEWSSHAKMETLLGVADFEGYDAQAEQGQGPPA